MEKFETGAVRQTGGKGRVDLLPMCALLRIAKHMEDSLTHYEERNWEKGMPIHCMIDSALRHLMKYVDGQKDEDHLCACATNLLMAMWTEEKMPQMQDIPTRLLTGVGMVKPTEPEYVLTPYSVHPTSRCNVTQEFCSACNGPVCEHRELPNYD